MKRNYTSSMTGTLNGHHVSAKGKGVFDCVTGLVSGMYIFAEIDNEFDLSVFNCVKVTGYPSICVTSDGVSNPFADGVYSYIREIDFGKHGKISYSANCAHTAEGGGSVNLQSAFSIQGNIRTPKLIKTEKVVETWTPLDGKRILGSFAIAWRTENGEYVCGHARTEYTPPLERSLEEIRYREIC